MSDPLLSVRDLRTQFRTDDGIVRAVDGVSFDVHPGEIVGLVGESGAGKSVVARSIMRLINSPGEIVGGEIRFRDALLFGLDESGEHPHPDMLSDREMREQIRGGEIALIFQDPMESLNPVFTVGEQLREIIRINRDLDVAEAGETAVEMLREVGIPEADDRFDDYPHEFSGGMRQRVLIAMALACEPSLIIADEPTTALDVTVEAQILRLVANLQDDYDTSFVWVTHDLGVVAGLCDRVNVMYLGEIVEQAGVDDLFYETAHPYTQALLDSMPRPDRSVEELTPIPGVMPEATDPPSGCRFHPRCAHARTACRENLPPGPRPIADDEDSHTASCFRSDAFEVGYWESDQIAESPETPSRDAENCTDGGSE